MCLYLTDVLIAHIHRMSRRWSSRIVLFERFLFFLLGLWIFVTLHEGNLKLFAALQGSESGRRLLALATPLRESPLLNWCFVIPFAGVLVPQLVFMAVGETRGKKRRRDSSASSIPEWPKADERWDPGGTFRSALDGWNKVCEFTGKRFVPYGWDGTRFNVHPRYHDDLPLFTRECCTHTMDHKAKSSSGKKLKLVKAIFCPTLHLFFSTCCC